MTYENFRLIARLDVKGSNLIKSVNLEGLRIVGNPHEAALNYYKDGIDEILYIDCVASLYGRNSLSSIISDTVKDVFVPITVGGGIRSVEDAREILRHGADKIAINTAAVKNPQLIYNLAQEFGSQCVVLYIEAKRDVEGTHNWRVFVENGRERTDLNVVEWASEGESLGAGEILLTSIDQEGTSKGFDIDLNARVASRVKIPVIASGGMGAINHIVELQQGSNVSAVAMADVLHYKKLTLSTIRHELKQSGVSVRPHD
jgi:imidazole glycerol-phosphate synthase subunit HisF